MSDESLDFFLKDAPAPTNASESPALDDFMQTTEVKISTPSPQTPDGEIAPDPKSPHARVLTDREIDAISKRNGVDPSRIKELAPWWSAQSMSSDSKISDAAKAGLAGVGETFIPFADSIRNALASTQLSDSEVSAMKDIKALISTKKSNLEAGLEFAQEIASPISAIPKMGLKATSAAMGALGAAAGAADAKPGERVEGALIGGAVGALSVPALAGAVKLAGASTKAKAAAASALGAGIGAYNAEPGEKIEGALIGGALGAASVPAAALAMQGIGKGAKVLKWLGLGATDKLAQSIHQDDLQSAATKVEEWAQSEEVMDRVLESTFLSKEGRDSVRKNAVEWVKNQPLEVRNQLARAANLKDMDDEEAVIGAAARAAKNRLKSFETHIGKDLESEGRNSVEAIVAQEAGSDPQKQAEWVAEKYQDAANGDRLRRVLVKNNAMGEAAVGTLYRLNDKVVASRHVLDSIDEKAGTRLTPVLDKISGGLAKANTAASVASKAADEPLRLARRAKLTDRELIDALEQTPAGGTFTGYTAEKNEAVNAWRKYTDSLLDQARQAGLPIEQLTSKVEGVTGYAPLRTKSPIQFSAAIRSAVRELGLKLSDDDALQRVLDKAKEFPDSLEGQLAKSVSLGDSNIPSDVKALRSAIKAFSDPSAASEKLAITARAAHERGASTIPDLVREYNVGRLYSNWITDTFRAAYVRDDVARLKTMGRALKDAGRKLATKKGFTEDEKTGSMVKGGDFHWLFEKGRYVEELANDLTFREATSLGASINRKLSGAALKMQEKSDELQDEINDALEKNQWFRYKAKSAQKYAVDQLTDPTEFLSKLSSNMYSNFLGGRPDAAFRNAYQVLVKTVPAMGTQYGSGVMMRAALEAVKKKAKGDTGAWDEATQRGLLTADASRAALANLQDGLESAGERVPKVLHRAVSSMLLAAYQAADNFNRALTTEMGRVLADDVMRASNKLTAGEKLTGADKQAVALFRSLPAGIRGEASAAVKRGDVDGARDAVERWLGGFTQLNYDRASMSRLGRWGGPVVSMFTTWPSSILGEVQKFARKGGDESMAAYRRGRVLTSLLGPFAVLSAVEHLAQDADFRKDKGEASPGRLLGRVAAGTRPGAAVEGAPLVALKAWTSGKMMPPLIGQTMGNVSTGLSGDFEKLPGAVGESLMSLAPYGTRAVKNFYRDWVPELGWEDRPYPETKKRGGLSRID